MSEEHKPVGEGKTTIRFHFLKSNAYRVIHADGAWGGLTPRLGLFMAFYSERPPIPQVVVHEIADGNLGPELTAERQTKDGIIREAEVGITMDLDSAKSLLNWLQEKIHQAEDIKAGREASANQTDDSEKENAGTSPEKVH